MNEYFVFLGNHWALVVLLIITIIAIFIAESLFPGSAKDDIDPQAAIQLMNHEHAAIIDIRSKDLFDQGYIIGSIHLPANEVEAGVKRLTKYKNKPVIIVSTDGQEAGKARAILVKNEFTQVKTLKGGITAWRNADLPLNKQGEKSND
jgi:rhodanese-related sulfurtransferase